MRTLTMAELEIGAALPELAIDPTPILVVSTAIATRDLLPVHRDPRAARAQGAPDIFLNILTTMGLIERYVTDWAGPEALLHGIDVRLGVPAYAGDRLTFTGTVESRDGDLITLAVRGTVSLGPHATATVRLTLPGGTA